MPAALFRSLQPLRAGRLVIGKEQVRSPLRENSATACRPKSPEDRPPQARTYLLGRVGRAAKAER
jgi:hypothetical protein